MSNNNLINILEKFKKVEKGILDPQRSGADGAEDDFIGKHIDNVEDHEDPANPGSHPHDAGKKGKRTPIKKHRKGYEKGEDETVYEEVELIDEEVQMISDLVMEALDEFMSEATDEEADIISEMLETQEGYDELINAIFEAKECDEDDEDDDEDGIIDDKPKLKKDKDNAEQKVTEDIERRADQKVVKVKTQEGKVVFRKQRPETELSKSTD